MLIDAGLGDETDDRTRKMLGVERGRGLDQALEEAGDAARGDRHRARDAPASRSRRWIHYPRRRRPLQAALSACPANRPPRRMGRRDAPERSDAHRLPSRPLHAAGRIRQGSGSWTRIRRSCRASGCAAPADTLSIIRRSGSSRTASGPCIPPDIMPTAAHVPAAWIGGIDFIPAGDDEFEKGLLGEVAGNGTLVLFDHDPQIPAARIVLEDGKPRALAPATAHRG